MNTYFEEKNEKLPITGKNSKTPNLDFFGKDLTKLALSNKLDMVIGREKEIKEVIQILNKRKKNNPLLIGEPGVGKTSIVEGLANKIANKEVDMWLLNKKIIEINLTSMVSGTKYRGDFEQRMEDLLKEIEDNDDVIVFFDEIHNIIGAGGTSGSMDAANIIKPFLSSGNMKCIGATTLSDYKKYIESEGAFERRFQKVYINEPSKEDCIFILNKIKDKYEDYHTVEYSSDVIERCVSFADKYITYRKFPDKAIDLLDETGAKVKLKSTLIVPERIKDLEKELQEKIQSKKKASAEQDFECAAKFRDEEKKLIESLKIERTKWEEETKKIKSKVTIEDVADIVCMHTGIPVNKLTDSDNKKLINLSNFLKENIIGQDESIKKISETLQRSRLGLQDPTKPMASFLFLGPTGVGKTLMAKLIALQLFNANDSFVRLDMSEYGEKHSVSRLIGSPPGYVGHEEKGQLTERVKNKPYSLILLDEVEKAHPDVFNVFLQVLDEGKLTDSTGFLVDFKNTIIIMTSNLGTKDLLMGNALGFNKRTDAVENNKELVFKELEKHFRPEFLNRIDEKIVFNSLGHEQINVIAEIEIKNMLERIKEKGFDIEIGDEVAKFIAEAGYEKKYGARPIKRAVQEKVGNLIAQSILEEKLFIDKKYKLILLNNIIEIKEVKKNARNKSK